MEGLSQGPSCLLGCGLVTCRLTRQVWHQWLSCNGRICNIFPWNISPMIFFFSFTIYGKYTFDREMLSNKYMSWYFRIAIISQIKSQRDRFFFFFVTITIFSIVVVRSLCIYYYAAHIFQCTLSESQAVIREGGRVQLLVGGIGVLASAPALPERHHQFTFWWLYYNQVIILL